MPPGPEDRMRERRGVFPCDDDPVHAGSDGSTAGARVIGALYRRIERAWHKILDNKIAGEAFYFPVAVTENECGTCHWWRGAVLGAGVGLAFSGRSVAGGVLVFLVLLLCAMQRVADQSSPTEKKD